MKCFAAAAVLSPAWLASAQRNYTASSDAAQLKGLRPGDVRYWMSVSELASVRQSDVMIYAR